ncbi:transglutaminase superfamily protein [Saccharothrix australiensis]|uniref:Transglutaminase superfamily protein n=2 Tax=Saccharothrix australiensis TaxID=2072 RepID=A0A495W3R8_9PSEU|nr:transglutaminase superfamily protein [Saccharothrix australiensis]
MRGRALCVLAAGAVAGLLFAPVFGLWALAPPIAAVLVACYAVVELCARVPALLPVRPVLALVAGAVALVEVSLFRTTFHGLPTAASLRALAAGVTDSWQLTLQSTWPVRPDAELLLFVPLLVLLTAVLGVELLRWPAVAVTPSLALLALSQAFVAVSGAVAVLVAFGYALVAACLLASWARSAVVPTVALCLVAGVAVAAVDPGPAFSLRRTQAAHAPLPRTTSPLGEVAARLSDPDAEVFSYTGDAPVDRWRLVVLDGFDGVTWTPADRYRRLGVGIGPPAGVTVPTESHSARLTVPGDGPWVPSQAMPASVDGIAPLVDEATGALLSPGRTGRVEYDLRWWEPRVDPDRLRDAGVSAEFAPGDLGIVPPRVAELAREATGGARPTFRSALVLEQYLSREYKVATGEPLPTGSGWPQLREFLFDAKRGTSEQFAAAYVVLARIVGIPARLAVGYRAPTPAPDGRVVVRNRDVLAWPEVAVAGVGWVPLDPAGGAGGAAAARSGLAQVTAAARADLPPPQDELPDPPLPADEPVPTPGPDIDFRELAAWAALGLVALLALGLVAIPAAKVVRTWRRRRLTGPRGVVAAWWEVRDRLRAHGTRVTPGMTPRDLAAVSEGPVADTLHRLAHRLDAALWSGAGADDGDVAAAWEAVREVRLALARRPVGARLKAVFAVR